MHVDVHLSERTKEGRTTFSVPQSIVGNAVAYGSRGSARRGRASTPRRGTRRASCSPRTARLSATRSATHRCFTYTMTGAFGAAEVDKSGKKVVLDSKAAVDAVKFMQAFWKECCDEGGLAWDDTNNRAFHAGEISATLNGASIYLVAKRQKDKIKDDKGEPLWQDIDHAPLPAGPAGPFLLFLNHSHAVMKYGKNQKLAKDLVRWLHKRENYEKWFLTQEAYSVGATKTWETHPMWEKVDGPHKMFRTAARTSRLFGYAGPSTAKATETFTKYIITDMYAKAVQGMKAEDAVKWAAGELKKIYEG